MTDTTKKAMTPAQAWFADNDEAVATLAYQKLSEELADKLTFERSPEMFPQATYSLCRHAVGQFIVSVLEKYDAHLAEQRDTHDALVSENSDLRAQCEYLQRRLDEQAAQREGDPVAKCPECGGAGVYPKIAIAPPPPDVTCRRCHGTGRDYTAPPHPRVEVTKERVERACQAFFVGNVRKPWPWRVTQDIDEPDAIFASMRAALEAALSEKGHG